MPHQTPAPKYARIVFAAIPVLVVLFLLGDRSEVEAHVRITTDISWSKDIRALLRTHCMRCHSPGGIAPEYVDLTTYGTDSNPGARAWATAIEEELMTDRMPPWQADQRYDAFENSRAMTQLEKDMIVAWVQGGAPQGPRRDLPPPPEFSSEPWELGQPDALVELSDVFVLSKDEQTATTTETKTLELEKDVWVTAYEFRTDAPHSVARASAWVIDDHLGPEELEVEIQVPYDPFRDEDEPEPTRMREMPTGKRFLGQWVRGDAPVLFPDGAGKRLRAGSKVELIVEYERSQPPKRSARTSAIAPVWVSSSMPPTTRSRKSSSTPSSSLQPLKRPRAPERRGANELARHAPKRPPKPARVSVLLPGSTNRSV